MRRHPIIHSYATWLVYANHVSSCEMMFVCTIDSTFHISMYTYKIDISLHRIYLFGNSRNQNPGDFSQDSRLFGISKGDLSTGEVKEILPSKLTAILPRLKMVVLYEKTTCLKIGMTFLGMYGFPLWVSGSTDIVFVSISQKLTTKRNKIPQLKAVQKDANSQFSALDIDPDLCLQPAGENARSAHQWSDIFDTSARALKPWVLVSPSPVTVTEFLHF